MRLHSPGLGPFHILMDPEDLAGIHDVASQSRFCNEVLDLPPVESLAHLPRQALPNVRLLAVPDGFQQQFAQGFATILQPSQHVEHLTAQRLPGFIQLSQQRLVNVAFPGALCNEVPQVADFGLADAVNATEALFNAVRIPWKVVVDHQVGALQVNTL